METGVVYQNLDDLRDTLRIIANGKNSFEKIKEAIVKLKNSEILDSLCCTDRFKELYKIAKRVFQEALERDHDFEDVYQCIFKVEDWKKRETPSTDILTVGQSQFVPQPTFTTSSSATQNSQFQHPNDGVVNHELHCLNFINPKKPTDSSMLEPFGLPPPAISNSGQNAHSHPPPGFQNVADYSSQSNNTFANTGFPQPNDHQSQWQWTPYLNRPFSGPADPISTSSQAGPPPLIPDAVVHQNIAPAPVWDSPLAIIDQPLNESGHVTPNLQARQPPPISIVFAPAPAHLPVSDIQSLLGSGHVGPAPKAGSAPLISIDQTHQNVVTAVSDPLTAPIDPPFSGSALGNPIAPLAYLDTHRSVPIASDPVSAPALVNLTFNESGETNPATQTPMDLNTGAQLNMAATSVPDTTSVFVDQPFTGSVHVDSTPSADPLPLSPSGQTYQGSDSALDSLLNYGVDTLPITSIGNERFYEQDEFDEYNPRSVPRQDHSVRSNSEQVFENDDEFFVHGNSFENLFDESYSSAQFDENDVQMEEPAVEVHPTMLNLQVGDLLEPINMPVVQISVQQPVQNGLPVLDQHPTAGSVPANPTFQQVEKSMSNTVQHLHDVVSAPVHVPALVPGPTEVREVPPTAITQNERPLSSQVQNSNPNQNRPPSVGTVPSPAENGIQHLQAVSWAVAISRAQNPPPPRSVRRWPRVHFLRLPPGLHCPYSGRFILCHCRNHVDNECEDSTCTCLRHRNLPCWFYQRYAGDPPGKRGRPRVYPPPKAHPKDQAVPIQQPPKE